MKGPGLNRQIVVSMSVVVSSVILIGIISTYVFYVALFFFDPPLYEDENWIPTGPEWVWLAALLLIGLLISIYFSAQLARRILTPINSVAHNLRKIAQGDLSARAETSGVSLGEASWLVSDFNTMAERIERMAGERVIWNAAIAHELRTPVTILRGRLQGLAEGVFTPDEKQFRNLLAQVEGLSRLIDDLRMLSLAESGHLELRRDVVDLSFEIDGLVQLMLPDFHAAGFTPVLNLTKETVFCDSARIRQIVLALLDNAKRYAQAGKIYIDTYISHDTYFLTVEDEGPGISDEIAAFIFDVFERGESSRSRQMGGSGLGLAVVRAIAQLHGGQAIYRHGSQGGSVFQVSWPR